MLGTPLPLSTGCHASGLRAAPAMRLFGSALMGTWRGHLTVMSAGDLIVFVPFARLASVMKQRHTADSSLQVEALLLTVCVCQSTTPA